MTTPAAPSAQRANSGIYHVGWRDCAPPGAYPANATTAHGFRRARQFRSPMSGLGSHKPVLHNAREKCQLLALAGSLCIVTGTVALTLLWSSDSRATYSTGDTSAPVGPGDYQSPSHCRECHAEEFKAWFDTSHADASFDPIFEVSRQKAQRPGECFTCHTTGYDTSTGQFALAGVTCEACHGPYEEGHSSESMLIALPDDLCGRCHTSTLAEWASSRHGRAQVACTACHEVHSQKIHAAENTNFLCADCHQDQLRDNTHAVHNEAGVHCIDCHLKGADDEKGVVAGTGQVGTGHTLAVIVGTCDDCHLSPLQPGPRAPLKFKPTALPNPDHFARDFEFAFPVPERYRTAKTITERKAGWVPGT